MPKKHIQYKSEVGKYFVSGGWGQGQSGKNQLTMRFSDLLLMAAECEVEVGTLAKAQEYVNLVRNRAKNGMVVMDGATPAANYVVNPYTAAWTDKAIARNAVRFERFIELGMEGHRFFDLVRWGIADQVKNEFFGREGRVRTHLSGARFTKGKDEYLPIPESVIAQSTTTGGKPALTQNPGY